MEVQPMPLHERIQRLESGYVAHPEYIFSAVRTMAETPITVYLSGCDQERERLQELLGLTDIVMDAMTYRDVAVCIYKIRTAPAWTKGRADEATALLLAPLVRCYEKRRAAREKSKANTSG